LFLLKMLFFYLNRNCLFRNCTKKWNKNLGLFKFNCGFSS
jgi:hypothetical protein